MPHEGMQEAVCLSMADIVICGGNRGGGKSAALFFDSFYDIMEPTFRALMFRKELTTSKSAGGLGDKANEFYKGLGAIGTELNTNWVFPSGAVVKLDHLHNESKREVEKRFKGLEIPAMYIDELDQILFSTFLKMMESNRNSHNIRNRMIGTCNPDYLCWLRTFLDWYIGEDGYIIPERDKKVRYFYVHGETVNDITWGNTKAEVYQKASSYIERAMTDRMKEKGVSSDSYIKSLQFIQGDLADNPTLMNDTSYLASISQGGEENIARNIRGNWNVITNGEEMITREAIDFSFASEAGVSTSGVMYLTLDIAGRGDDNCTMFVWDGDHLLDILAFPKLTYPMLIKQIEILKREYNIQERNIAFDAIGIGAPLRDFIPRAKAIEANARAEDSAQFLTQKDELMYRFGKDMELAPELDLYPRYSIAPHLLTKVFPYGRTKKESCSFYDIMLNERRVVKKMPSNGKTQMLRKKEMKATLGLSPDFTECFAYKGVFQTKAGIRGRKNSGFHYL